jgi:amino acid transporter
VLQIGSFLLVGMIFEASKIFEFLGTIASLAAIGLYIPANIALTVFVRREHPADFNIWRHGIVPAVGTLALLPVIVVTLLPIPDYPLYLTPALFAAMMLLGFVVMKMIETWRPGALACGGAIKEPWRDQESSAKRQE